MADGFEVIDAPPAAPARVGLIVSANRPPTGDALWENGLRFVAEAYRGDDLDEGGAWWEVCDLEDGTDPPDKGEGPGVPDPVSYLPWQVIESDPCLSRGHDDSRALRRLAANRPWKVEREFWSGVVAQAGGLPNDYLTNPATTDDLGSAGVVFALAALQRYLDDQIPGRGMIHATKTVVTAWTSAGLTRREGALILDLYDNVIVPGAGYDGTGPEGSPASSASAEWAYATGMVQFLDRPPTTVRSDDRSIASRNRDVWIAEQFVAAFHDGQAHGGVLVDLSDPCSTGAS